jgi:hypothetical protein
MKKVIVVVDKDCEVAELCSELCLSQISVDLMNTQVGTFHSKRSANKILNDYAVTQLPFVLLIDSELPEGRQEYAAVYSEEGPITIERINEKL